LLKAYDKWDTVMMPIHAADHAYLSFERTTLPAAVQRGVGVYTGPTMEYWKKKS